MDYIPIIGLEVHLQPKTKTKMFSRTPAKYFGLPPNTNICPVTLGLPGAMPVPNKVAIEKCILLSLGLNCSINRKTKFDRKNYFYPDLPKGYQISQFDKPFGYNGFIEFDLKDDSKRIRIKRIHMEEDTGKSIHTKDSTLLDFNKAGVPLIEIVTEPDFTSSVEVDRFAKRLRQTVRYLKISDANMEKGQMRYELNISMRKTNSKRLPDYKVEVKNISSISVLQKIIQKEIVRQSELLKKGIKPNQETRGLRDNDGNTATQRIKEEADDYRYFPEPDIPPISIDKKIITKLSRKLIELPQNKKHRYMQDYNLEPDTAEILISNQYKASFFEKCIPSAEQTPVKIKNIAKWIVQDISKYCKINKIKFKNFNLDPIYLVNIVQLLEKKQITGAIAKKVLNESIENNSDPLKIIETKKLKIETNIDTIEKFVDEVISQNAQVVKDIEKNPNAIKFLVGQVMKISKGKANPQIATEILEKKLKI